VVVGSPFFIRESFEPPVSRDEIAIHFNPVQLSNDFGLELLAFRDKSKMTTIRAKDFSPKGEPLHTRPTWPSASS
jgi:hypothetical protein